MSSFMRKRLVVTAAAAGLLLVGLREASPAASWDPAVWTEEDTVELRTQRPGEEPHWFPVWFVVIDGQMYVRLGSRAAERFETSQTKPVLGVRIEGQEFDSIEAMPAGDMIEAVGRSMAQKYWSDLLIRFFPHPLTLRLAPAASGTPAAS